jgi:iron-sulfur cluster repair protein YtfE (RIC family)
MKKNCASSWLFTKIIQPFLVKYLLPNTFCAIYKKFYLQLNKIFHDCFSVTIESKTPSDLCVSDTRLFATHQAVQVSQFTMISGEENCLFYNQASKKVSAFRHQKIKLTVHHC